MLFFSMCLRLGAWIIGASITTATFSRLRLIGRRYARGGAFHFQGDDAVAASPIKIDGDQPVAETQPT